MLRYLYTLDYDDNGEAASVANYNHGKDASANLQATTVTEEEILSADYSSYYHKLMNNIAVYAIADKYDIPELEVLAATKFEDTLVSESIMASRASIPAIIDAVFDATPDTKCGLRDAVIRYCTVWKEEIIDNEDLVPIVRDHGEIGLALIRQVFYEGDENASLMKARIEKSGERAQVFIWYIKRISQAATCIKVSDSREVQQSYIDAQHRRLGALREVIQEASDYLTKG